MRRSKCTTYWLRRCIILPLVLGVLVVAGCDEAGPTEPPPPGDPPPGPSEPSMLGVSGDIQWVHDPVIAQEDGRYYIFSTGDGIPIRCSTNFLAWNECGRVLPGAPGWARDAVPGVDHLWAPDIAFFNDRYHLYYSASTFGSNRSAIGLATSPTLDQDSDAYEWTDHGMVIESRRWNDYNAIDANVVIDEDGTPWMSFGSHWSGIKMVKLDAETGKPASEDPEIHALASRPDDPAIEAPFIIRRDDYYYLFVSFDACCQGASSTYNVRVGRSTDVTGPYVDQSGDALTDGGGTLIIESTDRWKGPGHQAVFEEDGQTYLIYHAYDAFNEGIQTLRISPLEWEDGWPAIPMD